MTPVSHPHNSQWFRSLGTAPWLVNTGTVCVVTTVVDQPVAAETTESPRTGRWQRWSLAGLLAATAVLYLWNLSLLPEGVRIPGGRTDPGSIGKGSTSLLKSENGNARQRLR